MRKTYIIPKTTVLGIKIESICGIVGSDGHHSADEPFEHDENIGYGGESNGEDFAKRYDAWSTWDD